MPKDVSAMVALFDAPRGKNPSVFIGYFDRDTKTIYTPAGTPSSHTQPNNKHLSKVHQRRLEAVKRLGYQSAGAGEPTPNRRDRRAFQRMFRKSNRGV